MRPRTLVRRDAAEQVHLQALKRQGVDEVFRLGHGFGINAADAKGQGIEPEGLSGKARRAVVVSQFEMEAKAKLPAARNLSATTVPG